MVYNVDTEKFELDLSMVNEFDTSDTSTPAMLVVPRRNRKRVSVDRLPVIKDPDGRQQRLDWSASNMERIGSAVWKEGSRRLHCPLSSKRHHICAGSFEGLTGTKDLVDAPQVPRLVPNLYSLAKNAINSMRFEFNSSNPRRGVDYMDKDFKSTDFVYSEHQSEGLLRYYSCRTERLPHLDYSTVGECILCDELAVLKGGIHFLGEGGKKWAFPTKDAALHYYLSCLILTTGTSNYYTHQLHNQARRVYQKFHKNLEVFKSAETKINKVDTSKRFVVCFRHEQSHEPLIYIVGNTAQGGSVTDPRVLNDFCIAIPDLEYISNHCGPNSRRPTKREGNGRALYMRPLHSPSCLFVEHERKKQRRNETRGHQQDYFSK